VLERVVVRSHAASQAAVSSSLAHVSPEVNRSTLAPTESAPVKAADRAGVAKQPRAAFTVVSAAETIQDVALRVYGTTEQVDSLWRANRDALPHKDSPLATGMVLRTPTIR